uniref:Large ribosomal subunit protein P1 n=1 Tax=Lygus hesperus TaxID=30085 RepID=A0A0A9YG09_LYGHE
MTQQLACTYAALMLHDSGKLDANSILTVTKAAGVDVSVGMAHAFANALSTVNINDVLGSMTFAAGGAAMPSGGATSGAAAGGAASTGPAAAAVEAKKEEPAEEEDDDMGFGLFD